MDFTLKAHDGDRSANMIGIAQELEQLAKTKLGKEEKRKIAGCAEQLRIIGGESPGKWNKALEDLADQLDDKKSHELFGPELLTAVARILRTIAPLWPNRNHLFRCNL